MTQLAEPDIDSSDTDILAARMLADPIGFKDSMPGRMHDMARADVETIQLSALKLRFAQLRDHVPVLKRLADDVGVTRIDTLNDVVPILFKHTVYKSYPASLLEKGRFQHLTQWLNKLVTVDLSGVDVRDCASIDDWIAVLDRTSPLELRYSSGTSGTMSFLPQTREETDLQFRGNMADLFATYHAARPTDPAYQGMAVILPNYRKGATGWARYADYQVKYLCKGDETRCFALYPGSVSADLMFLAGRLRAAKANGTLDRIELSPALVARKAEFEAVQARAGDDMTTFYNSIVSRLKGQRVHIQAPWSALESLADDGLARGLEGVFAADSVILAAGGAKGIKVADDWEYKVKRFLGVKHLSHLYGMTEVQTPSLMCAHDRYHVEPTNILFVLDPDSGEILPRQGSQTGRAAFCDLLPTSHWGGFVSGDEITVEWDKPCACGKLSPHIARQITRFTDKSGGDDKISCAAVSGAHEEALNYLVDFR